MNHAIIHFVCLSVLCVSTAFAQSQGQEGKRSSGSSCAAAVTSAQQAAEKADWVIEGTVGDVFNITNPAHLRGSVEVMLEKANMVWQNDRSRIVSNVGINLGPCFVSDINLLQPKDARKLIGKRMRFFGNMHVISPLRRFFYMQSADMPMPVVRTSEIAGGENTLVTQTHRKDAENPLPNGWHHAQSTDGKFSVDLPGPFTDVTRVIAKQAGFMLRAKDQYGSVFMALFERSGPDSEMAGSFDQAMKSAGYPKSTLKGFPAVFGSEPFPALDPTAKVYTVMLRVPGGTYLIGITTTREHEAESLKDKERFFNSLLFN